MKPRLALIMSCYVTEKNLGLCFVFGDRVSLKPVL